MKNGTAVLTLENTVQQAAAKGTCPVCALVRAYQNEIIEQLGSSGAQSVCSYHAWLIASGSPAAAVVNVFLHMLEQPLLVIRDTPWVHDSCNICRLLCEHEELRLREFAHELQNSDFRVWVERFGTVCRVHAQQLKSVLPEWSGNSPSPGISSGSLDKK